MRFEKFLHNFPSYLHDLPLYGLYFSLKLKRTSNKREGSYWCWDDIRWLCWRSL